MRVGNRCGERLLCRIEPCAIYSREVAASTLEFNFSKKMHGRELSDVARFLLMTPL